VLAALGPRWKRFEAFVSLHGARARARVETVQPRWFVALSMLLLITGVAFVVRLAQHSQAQLLASSGHVAHVMRIEERTRELVTGLFQAEHAVRRYVVADSREDAAPFQQALEVLPAQLDALRPLLAKTAVQHTNIHRLDTTLGESLDLLVRTMTLHDAGDREAAFALLLAGHVPGLLDGFRATASLIVLEEQLALARAQQVFAREAAFGRASLVFVVIVTLLFVTMILLLAYRVSRLQQLARMCAWSRTIEYEGEWISFEDYLERRFNIATTHGISPTEAAKLRGELPPE
jgi:CHASE3 domain sensor protein